MAYPQSQQQAGAGAVVAAPMPAAAPAATAAPAVVDVRTLLFPPGEMGSRKYLAGARVWQFCINDSRVHGDLDINCIHAVEEEE